jgi:hypothetical protein
MPVLWMGPMGDRCSKITETVLRKFDPKEEAPVSFKKI